jgi:adenylyl-sulfate kinase
MSKEIDETPENTEQAMTVGLPEVFWSEGSVTPTMRENLLEQDGCCIWLTGLSGAGKSTLANALDLRLHKLGVKTYLLDGDNIRHGLCQDLGMAPSERAENIRRVGEVARLMVDAGLVVICAFISPFRSDRAAVRNRFAKDRFIEVFVETPLNECERRDPKGLYKKARQGLIRDFTGIDSAYEPPLNPEISINTTNTSLPENIEILYQHFLNRREK